MKNPTPDFDALFESLPSGWLTKAEARLLLDEADRTNGPILEAGSYFGRSTVLLASLKRLVYAVDPFEGFSTEDPTGYKTQDTLKENLRSRDIHNVVIYRARIEDWPPRRAGFAYLDGRHDFDGTVAQIRKAQQCGAMGICVHDCNDDGGGLQVKRACLELLGPWAERVERLACWRVRS
jgi:hypothetical protein